MKLLAKRLMFKQTPDELEIELDGFPADYTSGLQEDDIVVDEVKLLDRFVAQENGLQRTLALSMP